MGLRYVAFRIWHIFQVKAGIFKSKFPSHPPFKKFISLQNWRAANIPFLIDSKASIELPKELSSVLESRFRESEQNNILFFNHLTFQLDTKDQWSKNPNSGHVYDMSKHWSQIEDLSSDAGDIKFVWEKARFSYVYDILRYDYHSGNDQASRVLGDIEDFIDKNPINLGPQYKCSQEISLRVLNWTYVLYYYKNSEHLQPELFDKIINSIYWQLHHVRKNIHFSRIAVRNNHAITETLMLYLSGLLFPFIPEIKKWSAAGLKWFEQEVEYQVYEDGTFLQYSMNYHRVVVQLLTWAIRMNELNGLRFNKVVYERAQKSLDFLDACIDPVSGKLPNYGSNDGALFFKFTDHDYRVYTSQLDDLRMALNNTATEFSESFAWYGMKDPTYVELQQELLRSFDIGGYYIINDNSSKTFIRCGAYKDRPAQADNLHIDIWNDGVNYFWDNGSYKYNTDKELLNHFMGTSGHNTVTVERHNQMKKGGRFIWYNWVKKAKALLSENDEKYTFNGSIKAFEELGTLKHRRIVDKKKGQLEWTVQDFIDNKENKRMEQHWHINPEVIDHININACDQNGNQLEAHVENSWHSSYYGYKSKSIKMTYFTTSTSISTTIKIKAI